MKQLERILAFSTCASLVFLNCLITPASAESVPTIMVSDTAVEAGKTGTISIVMKNNPGIISWRLALDYDSSVIEITDFKTGIFKGASAGSLKSDPFICSWSDPNHGDYTTNGTVATISFKVKENAADGDYEIKLSADPEDLFNSNYDDVDFKLVSGMITVGEDPEKAALYKPSVTVSATDAKQGETGTIKVNMNNNPGIIAWRLGLDYDSDAIEITGFDPGVFSSASCGPLTAEPFVFSWSEALNGNYKNNGNIATISYRVKNNAAPGEYNIKLKGDREDFFDKDFNDVKFIICSGKINVLDKNASVGEHKNPAVTYTSGNGSVKLKWEAVKGAQKYAVIANINGAWQKIIDGNTTSYTIKGLTAGKKYRVAVIAMFDGKWNTNDLSNAITVTADAASETAYPIVKSAVNGTNVELNWTKVKNAQGYAVIYQQGTKWKVLKSVSSSVTSFKLTNIPHGTYKLAVVSKVGGKWDTSNIGKSSVSVTV